MTQPFDQAEPPHQPPTPSVTDPDPAPRTAAATGVGSSILTDRRGVLVAAVGVVGAGALAACSSPPVADAPASSSAPGGASSGSGATPATSTGGETPAPAGTPTSDIPVGGGKIYADQQVVVTQPTAGQFKAFSAICTHQGCTVGQIEGGEIICPCHASHFSISTGAPTADSLAQSPLPEKSIAVAGGSFTVS